MRLVVFSALLLTSPLRAQAPPPSTATSGVIAPSDEAVINVVVDDWHGAAAKADADRYFGHFAPDGVFLGTDPTERWTVPEFRVWSKRFFDRGKAWSFTPKSRNVSVRGDVAWFDEALDTPNMGPCRGSGVLRKIAGRWKIAQYNLSIPIPNDLTSGFVKEIEAFGRRTPTPAPASQAKKP